MVWLKRTNTDTNIKHVDWFKKHADAVVILTGVLGCFIWMNTRFNDVDKRLSNLEIRLVRIETVMVVKGLVPEMLVRHGAP